MPRPILATIHRALRHNWRARGCAPDARVWGVVKANAYGHASSGVRWHACGRGFALLDLLEAEGAGVDGAGLLLLRVFEARDRSVLAPELWHVVHCARRRHAAMHKTTSRIGFPEAHYGMNDGFRTPVTARPGPA